MRYLTNKQTGKRYCLHCNSYNCICLPESKDYFNLDFSTELLVVDINPLYNGNSNIILFSKQKLPNGRIIKSGSTLCVPAFKWVHKGYGDKRVIMLSNDIINKSFY